jgi:hypothetical protein
MLLQNSRVEMVTRLMQHQERILPVLPPDKAPLMTIPSAVSEEDKPMFNALEEAPPPILPEEVPSHTSLNQPSSQIFDSSYINSDGARHSSHNKPDYHSLHSSIVHPAVLLNLLLH